MPDKEKERAEAVCNEWNECRCSIARFDTIIVDIRKYGFTLITGPLTADAFLFVKVSEL